MKLWQRRCLMVMGLGTLAYLTHSLWQPVPMHRGRPVREWVRRAMDGENWGATIEDRRVVASELRARAVPDIIRELEDRCHSKLYRRARQWQYRLPRWCRLLPEPKDTRASINAAGLVLLEMGEPARPAIPALVRCVDQAPMSFAECQEVIAEIVGFGPVASEALPLLRRMASDPQQQWAVQAALAIYAADDSTNLLAETISRALAKPDGYHDFYRELFWFREDERLNRIFHKLPAERRFATGLAASPRPKPVANRRSTLSAFRAACEFSGLNRIVVPLLSSVATNTARSFLERNLIAWYLGEVRTSDPLPRDTLKLLLEQNPDEELRKTASEALQKLETAARTNAAAVKAK